jgi:stress response protein YsnF
VNGFAKNAGSRVPLSTRPGAEGEVQVAVERLDDGEGAVLPLVEEALRVGKRRVETGRVRISVATDAEERIVRETLRGERAEVERVAIDRELAAGEAPPVARHEADGTYVLPVLEEVLVIERRLVLREEIRMRLVTTEEPVEEVVTLRRQRAEVERVPPLGASGPQGDAGTGAGSGSPVPKSPE